MRRNLKKKKSSSHARALPSLQSSLLSTDGTTAPLFALTRPAPAAKLSLQAPSPPTLTHQVDVRADQLPDGDVELARPERVFPATAQRVGRDRVGHARQHVLVVLLAALVQDQDVLQVGLHLARVDGRGRGRCRHAAAILGRRGVDHGRLLDERGQAPVLGVPLQDAGSVDVALLLQGQGDVQQGWLAKGVGHQAGVGVQGGHNVLEQAGQAVDKGRPAGRALARPFQEGRIRL